MIWRDDRVAARLFRPSAERPEFFFEVMVSDRERQSSFDARLRPGARIGAVVSSYHSDLTLGMLASASEALEQAGMEDGHLDVVWVPGAFELPLVARRMARRADIDAVLCIGVILKGETQHDEVIAAGVTQGIVQASMETDTPILFGVLTCRTLGQARARALGTEARLNKGLELGRAAVEVLAALAEASGPARTTS